MRAKKWFKEIMKLEKMQFVCLLFNKTQSLQPLRKHPVMSTKRKQSIEREAL